MLQQETEEVFTIDELENASTKVKPGKPGRSDGVALDLDLQAIENPITRGTERNLEDFIEPVTLAKSNQLPYPHKGEKHARHSEPSTDRANIGF